MFLALVLAHFTILPLTAADNGQKKSFDIPAGDAISTLKRAAQQAGLEIVFLAATVEGVKTNGITGDFTIREALNRMLAYTDLAISQDAKTGALTVSRATTQDRAKANEPSTRSTLKSEDDETVTLSAFVVDTSQDKGYMATNTLSGIGIDMPLAKLPQTIQIANQELIQDLGAGSGDLIKAALMSSAGVSRRSYNNGDDQFIWGFRVNYSLRDSTPTAFFMPLGKLYDVDRIEIVKGPAAMLFGQASFVGGVINYITRKPTRNPHYSFNAAVGSFSYYSGAAHASGPINKKLRYRADVGATEYKGRRLFTHYRDRFVGAAFEYDLADTTTLLVEGNHSTNDHYHTVTILDPDSTDRMARVSPTLGDRSFNAPFANYDTTVSNFSMKMNTLFSNGLSSKTYISWNQSVNDWLRDQTNGPLDIPNKRAPKHAIQFYFNEHSWFVQQDFSKEIKTGPLTHRLSLGGDARWRISFQTTTFYTEAGVPIPTPFFSYANPDYSNATFAKPTPLGQVDTVLLTRTRISGGYFQDVITLWDDRITLLGGLRYTEQFEVTGTPIVGFGASTPTQTLSAGSVKSKRYGITVEPVKNYMAYYNYSESFLFNTGLDYLNRPFVPSIGQNKELGVKAQFFDGALAVSVARFDIKITNVRVIFVQGPNDPQPGQPSLGQFGSQTNSGYDFTLNGSKKFEAGTVNLIATHYQGDIRDATNLKPVNIPNITDSIWGTFDFSRGPLRGAKVGLGAHYMGERMGPTLQNGTVTRIPDYTNARAMASYTWGRTRFQLNVDNIFDKRYIEALESTNWINTDPGRVFKFTVDYSY